MVFLEKSLVKWTSIPSTMTETASEVWGTAVLVFLVPLGLAIVHYIFPGSFQDAMVFDHSEFSTITLWTSAYVHLGVNHLLSNLLGYAVGLVPTWLLFAQQQRHRVFRRLLLVFVVGFPPLIAIGDYMISRFGCKLRLPPHVAFPGSLRPSSVSSLQRSLRWCGRGRA